MQVSADERVKSINQIKHKLRKLHDLSVGKQHLKGSPPLKLIKTRKFSSSSLLLINSNRYKTSKLIEKDSTIFLFFKKSF